MSWVLRAEGADPRFRFAKESLRDLEISVDRLDAPRPLFFELGDFTLKAGRLVASGGAGAFEIGGEAIVVRSQFRDFRVLGFGILDKGIESAPITLDAGGDAWCV